MTSQQQPSPPSPPPNSASKSMLALLRERASLAVQLFLSLVLALGVLTYLVFFGSKAPTADEEKRPTPPQEVVQLAGPRAIKVLSGTPLSAKLTVASVENAWLTAPVLPVTGTTVASLRPAKDLLTFSAASTIGAALDPLAVNRLIALPSFGLERRDSKDAWQFATSDLLSAFTDWEKAVVDVRFQNTQLQLVRELAGFRVEAQKEVVSRMERLVREAQVETVKSLVEQQVNLRQFELQGRQDVHAAENAVRVAEKSEATFSRQLQQAGLEPTSLRSAAAEGDIVVAEVPERVVSRVKLGMTCEVRFFALPNRTFTGKVSSISPVISKEKRVLNVQFTVKDPNNEILPGMFAEIGLGTDKRQTLLMPADGVLHVGDKDYALTGEESGSWHITEVETGELRGGKVEVLSGLKAGERVLGRGAILLKPMVVQAVQGPESGTAVQVTAADGNPAAPHGQAGETPRASKR